MSQKGLTGGWDKYGGGRQHVVKQAITKTWYCQACRKEKPKEMTPYLAEIPGVEGDYIRVCSVCLHDGVEILVERKEEIHYRGWD